MFVWYHYFAAKEWYNWIRVYIACYVWMTGFGKDGAVPFTSVRFISVQSKAMAPRSRKPACDSPLVLSETSHSAQSHHPCTQSHTFFASFS